MSPLHLRMPGLLRTPADAARASPAPPPPAPQLYNNYPKFFDATNCRDNELQLYKERSQSVRYGQKLYVSEGQGDVITTSAPEGDVFIWDIKSVRPLVSDCLPATRSSLAAVRSTARASTRPARCCRVTRSPTLRGLLSRTSPFATANSLSTKSATEVHVPPLPPPPPRVGEGGWNGLGISTTTLLHGICG